MSKQTRELFERLKEDPKSADAHYLMGVWNYFQGKVGPTVEEMWGAPQAHEEKSMVVTRLVRKKKTLPVTSAHHACSGR